MKPLPLTLAALLCALAAPVLADGTFDKIKIDAGAALFTAECRRCHATEARHDSYGPPLENVIGRKAGTAPDYQYSAALKGSGIVWTEPALRAWMEDNTGFMPGTRMRHVGIVDPTVQEFILSYLRSISTAAAN